MAFENPEKIVNCLPVYHDMHPIYTLSLVLALPLETASKNLVWGMVFSGDYLKLRAGTGRLGSMNN